MELPYRFTTEEEPDPFDLAVLEESMTAAAVAAAGVGEEREFGVFARDDAGHLVGGASGTFWGGCCHVHVVWVDESVRGQGLGRALMDGVEAEARRQGCRLVMGLTYSALTGDYYDRRGYRIVGEIEDCPGGTSTRWYRKDL